MDKEKIKETLDLLRDFAHWMYCEPESYVNFLKDPPREMDGVRFTITIDEKGCYEINVQGQQPVKYGVYTQNLPVSVNGANDMIYYGHQFLSHVPEDKKEFYNKVAVFIYSAFQRKQAFVFLSRMQPETIEAFSKIMSSKVDKL